MEKGSKYEIKQGLDVFRKNKRLSRAQFNLGAQFQRTTTIMVLARELSSLFLEIDLKANKVRVQGAIICSHPIGVISMNIVVHDTRHGI